MKRLSQTLHLCFFCVLDDILDENWPIMDCGAGTCRPVLIICYGLGSVRDICIESYPPSDALELYSVAESATDATELPA